MFWSEDKKPDPIKKSDTVVDATVKLSCKEIPIDHAYELSVELQKILPWLTEDQRIAVHQIYIPASGNGWQRPEADPDAKMRLSRRTRLKIRLPIDYLNKLNDISGQQIQISGESMTFGEVTSNSLPVSSTLVSRFVYINDTNENEDDFLHKAYAELTGRGLKISKMLCGKSVHLKYQRQTLLTRSLMIAEITPEDSIAIQESGIGENNLMGCGIFIPQKGIKAVNDTDE